MSSRILGVAGLAIAVCFSNGPKAWAQATATTTTVTTNQIAGVEVDAEGVLRMHKFADPGGTLSKRRIAEARAALSDDVTRPSDLRKVSLNRLEAAVRERLDRGESITEEMQYLAGLTRVRYVFFYPDTNDIVIAGPAEGWATDLSGRVRGIESGSSIVELQDLVVALRAFPPQGKAAPIISCSIDPTQEGLANMQEFLSKLGRRATPRQTRFIADGLRRSLGMQTITVTGVPANTHFAQILVEADYRMKLIGIGLERTSVKFKSYVDLANPASVARNAMQRWYFVPNYECVRMSDDELAMELVGLGVKLVGADELVAADGTRAASGSSDRAGRLFTQGFTAKYEQLSRAVPVYAQLRNCVDLAVACAFIQDQDYYGRAGWSMEVFGDESQLHVETAAAPSRVESAVASVWRGRRLMTPIGGGVEIRARNALAAENLLEDERGEVATRRESIKLDHLNRNQWWWD